MSVPISTARATLPELIDRVEAGDEIVLTRHGRPVAVLVHPTALRARRADSAFADAATLTTRLAAARASGRITPRLSATRAADLVDAIDRDRDA